MIKRIVIEPGKIDREYFKDLWRFRELFYVLAWRDISVRYKQTAVGIAWAILRPALSTAVLSIVFGKLGKLPSGGVPYAVMVLTGMLPWQLFSSALGESGNSLLANSNLITKVYFPRLIIPASSLVTSLVDFGISLSILAVLMAFYRVVPSWHLVALPVFVLLALLAAGAVGAWVSALNVRYRDFAYAIPFLVQMGLYVSPVAFSSTIVPERWRVVYSLNPMVGVIEGFRWCVLGRAMPVYWPGFLMSMVVTAVLAVGGFVYFRRTERSFADVI